MLEKVLLTEVNTGLSVKIIKYNVYLIFPLSCLWQNHKVRQPGQKLSLSLKCKVHIIQNIFIQLNNLEINRKIPILSTRGMVIFSIMLVLLHFFLRRSFNSLSQTDLSGNSTEIYDWVLYLVDRIFLVGFATIRLTP